VIGIFGPTAVEGRFNVIGTEDEEFIIQGSLSLDQLEELKKEIEDCLKANGRR
jgi:hypothetical protein